MSAAVEIHFTDGRIFTATSCEYEPPIRVCLVKATGSFEGGESEDIEVPISSIHHISGKVG